MHSYTLGVDVGGTKTAYGLFDESGALLARRKRPTDASLHPEAFFDGLVAEMDGLLRENGLSREQLDGVGIGVPSYVLFDEGRIIKTVNLPLLCDFSARTYLRGRLGADIRVVLDNDAHTAALAEHRYGAGRGRRHMLYCPVSSGISSAIIINGELFRGSYGWAGESGHMVVTPGQGLSGVCACGNLGCLMSYCAGMPIAGHIRKRIESGEQTIMTKLAGGAEAISCEHLLAACEQKDPMALWALEQMTSYMGLWLYNIYVLLNIDFFVLGGGLLHFGDRLFGRVREVFDRYNQNELPVTFRPAELGDDLGVIGARELLYPLHAD